MYYSQVIRDCFKRFYVIIPHRNYSPGLLLDPVDFWDLEYTRIFISNLYVPEDYWDDRLNEVGIETGFGAIETEIAASQALLNRQLTALEVMPPQLSEAGQTARTLQQDETIYQIRHASVILLDNPQLKTFNTQAEAKALLQQFNLDKDNLNILIKEGNWKTNPSVWSYERKIEELAKLILANKMVMSKRPVPAPPKPESTSAPATSDVGNRKAGLGPESPEGLHNQDWDKVEVKDQSFKTTRQVDMDNLAEDEAVAHDELKRQGWDEDKIEQVINSGDNFTTKELKAGEKLYGFNTEGRQKNIKNSAYWLDESGYKDVKSKYHKNGTWDKEGVKNHLALPCYNRASSISTVEVTETTTVVQSRIVRARELIQYSDNSGYTTGMLGKIMPGGGTQITANTTVLSKL